MNAALIAFCRALVADPRSLRAIDETVLDWRLECREAPSIFARPWCYLQSVLALARVLGGSLPRELARIASPSLALRVLGYSVLPALLFVAPAFSSLSSFRRVPSPTWIPELVVSLVPASMVLTLPFAWMIALAATRRRLPALGAVVAAFASVLVLVTSMIPAGNNHYYGLMWETFNIERGTATPYPYRLAPMFWGLFDAQPGVIAMGLVVRDVLLATFASVLAFFGSQVARLNWRRRRWWLSAAMAPVLLVLAAPLWIWMLPRELGLGILIERLLLVVYPVSLLVAGMRIALRSDRPGSSEQPEPL